MLHTFPPIYNDPLGNFCVVKGSPSKRLHRVPHKLYVVLSVPLRNSFLTAKCSPGLYPGIFYSVSK